MTVYGNLREIAESYPEGSLMRVGLDYLLTIDSFAHEAERGSDSVRVEIDGDRVFALHQAYTTKPASEARFEAHRSYIDLQYVVEGTELLRVAKLSGGTEEVPYDPAKDIAWYSLGPGEEMFLTPGVVAILHPEDLHAPCLAVGEPSPVAKVVVKVLLQQDP